MQCKCGFDNAPGALFCGKCGSPLGAQNTDAQAPGAGPLSTPEPASSTGRSPRLLMTGVVVLIAMAVAGYWWQHRTHGKHKRDHSGLYGISVNGKHGFMDRSGKTVIAPQFDEAYGFSDGLAAVKVGNKFGFVNPRGELVITPQFDSVSPFSDGLASVQVGTKFGYIDPKGLLAISPQFDDATSFKNGRAAVKLCCGRSWGGEDGKLGKGGKNQYGFIDKQGKYIGTPGFLYVQPNFGDRYGWTSGDATIVRTADDRFGVLNAAGNVVIADKVDEIWWMGFTDGLAPAAAGGKWGYLNPKGEWAIAPQYEHTYGFEEGLAAAQIGERTGLIDRNGKFVVNPQYDHIFGISEGYALFESGKGTVPGCQYCANFGVIDTNGKVVVDAKFVQRPDVDGSYRSPVQAFSEGLAAVKTDAGWGFIDTTGKMVIEPQFEEASSFEDGLAPVTILGKEAYINKDGTFVVDPFPGTTVQAMKARVIAETRQKIAGEWMGTVGRIPGVTQFGNVAFAHLIVNEDGRVVVTVPEGIGQAWRGQQAGWRDVLRGQLDRGNPTPTSLSATLAPVYGDTSQRYRVTLSFIESSQSVGGYVWDASGSSYGPIEVSRPGE
jgi:hypothetical protein